MALINHTACISSYHTSFGGGAGVIACGVARVLDVGAVLCDAAAAGHLLEDAAHTESFKEVITWIRSQGQHSK